MLTQAVGEREVTTIEGLRDHALVDAFVAEQEDRYAEREAAAGVDAELRQADYERLQWADRFSLAFCLRGWDAAGEPFEVGSYRFEPLGPWRARVSPWPFVESEVACALVRRLVPKRAWQQTGFREAFFQLPAERVAIGLEA